MRTRTTTREAPGTRTTDTKRHAKNEGEVKSPGRKAKEPSAETVQKKKKTPASSNAKGRGRRKGSQGPGAAKSKKTKKTPARGKATRPSLKRGARRGSTRGDGGDKTPAKSKARPHADIHTIRATKAESNHLRLQLVQYMDSGGYVTWSAKRRKYMIMGTSATNGGLVPCPECGVGQLLVVRSPKSGKRFIGCSNFYGGCDASSPLLQKARLRATKKACGVCKWPEVIFRYSIRQKWTRQCSNISCSTRAQARSDA